MQKTDVKELVTLGILTGMTILLSYMFALQTPFIRVTFGFLPVALAGFLYGPWKSATVAALADIIGAGTFSAGSFFPGFTLSSFLAGYIYGFFFYKKRITLKYACVPFLLVTVLIHLGLNTCWLVLYYDRAASVIFMGRLIKNVICFPVEVGLFMLLYRQVIRIFPHMELRDPWSFKWLQKKMTAGK